LKAFCIMTVLYRFVKKFICVLMCDDYISIYLFIYLWGLFICISYSLCNWVIIFDCLKDRKSKHTIKIDINIDTIDINKWMNE
jgi:hypothetical protein